MNTAKPEGKLTAEKVETTQNKHAVYIEVFFKDESGRMFKLHTSAFLFQLEQVDNQVDNEEN